MLMAEGRHQLPSVVVANNFLNYREPASGEVVKISKSTTPAESPVWIEEFVKRFDPDALRYYLTAIAPEAARTTFDPQEFIAQNNGKLIAWFANFVNRFPKFIHEDFGGKIPEVSNFTEPDRAIIAAGDAALRTVGDLIEAHRFRAALDAMMEYASRCNEYIGVRAPWKSRKTDLADTAACVATCAHAAQYLAVLAAPFMPGAARRILRLLGRPDESLCWASPSPPLAGAPLGEATILFTKLEPGALS
jgi:methionyl-tRNA synthetase